MRVLVLGGSGMLGHKVYQTLRETFDTRVTLRSRDAAEAALPGLFDPAEIIDGVDARDPATVRRAIALAEPEAVINCIGIIKQLPAAHDAVASISVNALLPHQLAEMCAARGARLVHISTDCVFSGRQGGYTEADIPDPPDLYGRSKLLGEVTGPGAITLRTSIIGRELASRNGLVEWFLSAPGPAVRGYTQAVFSGLPTLALAQVIAQVVHDFPEASGLYHVAADPIAKFDLLQLLGAAYGRPVTVEPFPDVRIDRSLDGSRFAALTGFRAAPWPELIAAMAADPTPYTEWRSAHGH
ncbi:MAG: SDR family oxidoreductase [Thermomicrobiales bacterium]